MSTSNRRVLVYEKLRPGMEIAHELQTRGIEAVLPFGPASCLRRDQPITEDAMIELAAGFPAIVGASCARITKRVMEGLPELKVVSKIGIGHEVIDVEAATNLGVQVTNTPSLVEIDSVAEHAIALMLATAKRLDFYTPGRMAAGTWLDPAVSAIFLRGKTVGVIGYGRIARAVVARLQGWGVEILASDVPGRVLDVQPGVTMVGLNDLLAVSDFISLHVSTSNGLPPVIGRAELKLVKSSAVLVNTSRGANIDASALFEALTSGRLFAAALDVFNPEPPIAGDPLLRLPNVIATPHLGAVTPESEADMEHMAVQNVHSVLDGIIPEPLVNPDVLTQKALRVPQPTQRRDSVKAT